MYAPHGRRQPGASGAHTFSGGRFSSGCQPRIVRWPLAAHGKSTAHSDAVIQATGKPASGGGGGALLARSGAGLYDGHARREPAKGLAARALPIHEQVRIYP